MGLTGWYPDWVVLTAGLPTLAAAIILAIAYDRRFALVGAAVETLLVTVSLDFDHRPDPDASGRVMVAAALLDEVRTRPKLCGVGLWTAWPWAARGSRRRPWSIGRLLPGLLPPGHPQRALSWPVPHGLVPACWCRAAPGHRAGLPRHYGHRPQGTQRTSPTPCSPAWPRKPRAPTSTPCVWPISSRPRPTPAAPTPCFARSARLPRHRQDQQARVLHRKPGRRAQPPRQALARHEPADHRRATSRTAWKWPGNTACPRRSPASSSRTTAPPWSNISTTPPGSRATAGAAPPPRSLSSATPVPTPQTREAAIIMLADSVESAVRSLDDPTARPDRPMVHQIAGKPSPTASSTPAT